MAGLTPTDPIRSEPSAPSRFSEARGFVEILDRGGHVTHRIAVLQFPVSVGRAYDNDVIIDDAYVCPHHLRIDRDGSEPAFAEDLGSVNGLFVPGGRRPVPMTPLRSGNRIRIGHTWLRYRDPGDTVDPALPDHHTKMLLRAYESRFVQGLVFLTTLGILWLSNFLETVERRDATEPALELVIPVLFVLCWGAIWAFVGRVTTHRLEFSVHCAIVASALIALFVLDATLDYVAFIFTADDDKLMVGMAAGVSILVIMLYSHLRFSSIVRPSRLAGVALTVSITLASLFLLKLHIDGQEFSASPRYHVTLKAPFFRLFPGESPDEFFSRVEGLREEVSSHVANDQQ